MGVSTLLGLKINNEQPEEKPMPDMLNLFRQAQLMKEKMAKFQEDMEGQTFTGSSGAVTVTLNGKHEVQTVLIDPQTVQPEKTGELQEQIQAAINMAGNQVNAKLKEEVSRMTGGLGLPGLF
jgi:DNA-binding YbaB/EbfC family protein